MDTNPKTGIESAVLNNGFTSEWFGLSCSLCQGDPISLNLFLLTVEVLGIKLRRNTVIKRVAPDISTKLHAQFADDMWTNEPIQWTNNIKVLGDKVCSTNDDEH